MTKPPKRPRDVNQWAKHMVDLVTGNAQDAGQSADESSPAARGQKGGLKGGKARARRLAASRRKEIATKAAKTRWERR